MTMSFILCAATCCGTWSAVPVDFFRGGLFVGLLVCGRVGRLSGRLLRVVVVRSTCITTRRVWIAACIHSRVCLCDCVAGGGCLLMLRTRSPDRMSARRAGDGSVTVFTTTYPLLSMPMSAPSHRTFSPCRSWSTTRWCCVVVVILVALGGMLFVADFCPAACRSGGVAETAVRASRAWCGNSTPLPLVNSMCTSTRASSLTFVDVITGGGGVLVGFVGDCVGSSVSLPLLVVERPRRSSGVAPALSVAALGLYWTGVVMICLASVALCACCR